MEKRIVILVKDSVSVLEKIQMLDLEPIMVKLMDPVEGEGWTLAHVRETETWYRRFLYLNALYPNRSIVPTKAIDTFWHYHILDTEKYAEDCQRVFDYFLHHFPYFGMRGDEDRQNLLDASRQTWDLFRDHFNEEPMILGGEASKCSKSCTGKSCSHCKAPTCGSGPKVGNNERPRLATLTVV
jgi:hypothetical protein